MKCSSRSGKKWFCYFALAIAIALAGAFALIPRSQASRLLPAKIPAVTIAGIRFKVANTVDKMGIVEAYGELDGKKLWQVRLYRVWTMPWLETDVQWVFIERMWPEGSMLIVADEMGREFQIDPSTRKANRRK